MRQPSAGELGEHEKWCPGCLRVRDRRTDFGPDPRNTDKLNGRCRNCCAAYVAAWRTRRGQQRAVSTRPGTVGGRILAYLRENSPSKVGDIAAALGVSAASVSVNLQGLRAERHVRNPAYGVYCCSTGCGQGCGQNRDRPADAMDTIIEGLRRT